METYTQKTTFIPTSSSKGAVLNPKEEWCFSAPLLYFLHPERKIQVGVWFVMWYGRDVWFWVRLWFLHSQQARFLAFRGLWCNCSFSCSPLFCLKAVRSEVRNCGKLLYFATMTGSFVKKALIKRLLFRVMEFQLCPHLDMIGLRKFSRADGWFFQFSFLDMKRAFHVW